MYCKTLAYAFHDPMQPVFSFRLWSGTNPGLSTWPSHEEPLQLAVRRGDSDFVDSFTLAPPGQTLGWTRPKLRTSAAADRWTWLIIAAHTQLRRARPLVSDLRRPWEKPAEPSCLTPARVRRGGRNPPEPALPDLCAKTQPTRPGQIRGWIGLVARVQTAQTSLL